MKNLISGMLFVAALSLSFSSPMANAQGMGGDGSEKWVCCQVNYESYCTDMGGNGWNRDVKKYERTC